MSATFKIQGLQERAPKLETSKGGKKYTRVSLTVTSDEGRKTWFNNIMMWEKMAEDYTSKTKEGQEIEITGNLYVKMETDSSNQRKATISLDVKSFKVLSKTKKEEAPEEEPSEEEPDFDSFNPEISED